METTHLNAPRSVLFIGNSYTYCNDLPSLFGELARSRGYELQVRSVTKGGHTLEGHADPADECGAKLEALLQSERFDAVFLQEFSVRPALDDKTPFFNAVRTLCARLRRTGDVRILLYQTWGRKEPCETLDAHGWDEPRDDAAAGRRLRKDWQPSRAVSSPPSARRFTPSIRATPKSRCTRRTARTRP